MFINPILLTTLLLIGIPILLHTMMRRRPRPLDFPALRLVQETKERTRRRLRFQHILLLLLRIGVIAFFVIALARPTSSSLSAVDPEEGQAVSALFLFDTAPRCDYKVNKKTRLEIAKEAAAKMLDELPPKSEIAILTTDPEEAEEGTGVFLGTKTDSDAMRRRTALQRIEQLHITNTPQTISAALARADRLLKKARYGKREIFIFSDQSENAWAPGSKARIQPLLQEWQEKKNTSLYVIDVAAPQLLDVALGKVTFDDQTVAPGGLLRISTVVSSVGDVDATQIRLVVTSPSGKEILKRQQTIALTSPAMPVTFSFLLSGLAEGKLAPGFYQGKLVADYPDTLQLNNSTSFTFEVRDTSAILVVAPEPVGRTAHFFVKAIASQEELRRGKTLFAPKTLDYEGYEKLSQAQLRNYAAIYLLDPPTMQPITWKKLADYTAAGGGLGVFLGKNLGRPSTFAVPQAKELLPALPTMQARSPEGDVFLFPEKFTHPILKPFYAVRSEMPFSYFPVFRYWLLGELHPSASVLVPYNDQNPGILVRRFGKGNVVLWTTPLSFDPKENAEQWNHILFRNNMPINPYVFMTGWMTRYLAGGFKFQLNFPVGEAFVAQVPPREEDQTLELKMRVPSGVWLPVTFDARNSRISATSTQEIGNYRVVGEGEIDLRFSTHFAEGVASPQRVEEKRLKEIFGDFPVKWTSVRQGNDGAEIAKQETTTEWFTSLILLMIACLVGEHLFANRFYRK